MNSLITADLHLTDSPADEYRWEIFQFLDKQIKKHLPDELIILGDLTERKDRHSSALVNRLVRELLKLAEIGPVITILKGNHDQLENEPFFGFINAMEGVRFIDAPIIIDRRFYIPYMSNEEFKTLLEIKNPKTYDIIFMHQPVEGAVIGLHRLEGISKELLPEKKATYSGHIHQAQSVGKMVYVGAPYPIDFGDQGNWHVILLQNGEEKLIPHPTLEKLMIKIDLTRPGANIKELLGGFLKGDQVKIEVLLARSDFAQWKDIRKEVKKILLLRGTKVVSIKMIPQKTESLAGKTEVKELLTTDDLVRTYAQTEKVGSRYITLAKKLIEETP